eukprot:1627645-Rhodomonas_salina.1
MYDVAMQAISNQCCIAGQSECWNCSQLGHQRRFCPYPEQHQQGNRSRPQIGGVRGVGGARGAAGGAWARPGGVYPGDNNFHGSNKRNAVIR